MKIVLTYPFLTGKGGMETVIKKILLNVPSTIQLDFLLPGGSKDESWIKGISRNNVKLVFHDFSNPVSILYDTFSYVRKEKPDAVITMNNLQIIPLLAARSFVKNMKIISWNHFSLKHTKANFLLQKCDLFLAISSGIVDELGELGIDSSKVHLVYNPIDKAETLIPSSQGKEKKLIYVGRVQYEDQKNLAELFKILSHVNYAYRLEIYGDGPTQEKEKLNKLADSLGISTNITWNGWKNNVWGSIKCADLALLTSSYEGFALALAEAASHGIPVISSDCPSGPRDIINSVNGRLYEPGNINQAVSLINDFFTGKLKFGTPKEITNSIEKFYTPNYINNFFKIISEEK
ncbi:glycosyltransferase [Ligilactobacillus aviarius]|uniref:glycosyltransferase n=1 Tax=Ligilactobacillus aviarius TaxID=1606 RepID=UPI0025A3B677|nr:glycosyltransferase [Ligilactobacillus aviarius]MDM8278686.1 glycosyltransferase [Ligilactobacillus aviarius]